MLPVLLASISLAPSFSFLSHGPYEPRVPEPESILGYAPGARHTVYRDQEQVVLEIARAMPGRVKVIPYGKSVQGRPLRIVAISGEENIRRLDVIRSDNAKIASGAPDPAAVGRTPSIVWINECIHGDETASFESGMWLLYNLAASNSPRFKKLRQDSVVLLNPVYNPDGHERYVVWYNSFALGSPRSEAFEQTQFNSGRTNYYRFDMNRDRVSLSQDETRQEVAEYLKWNPHVYVDQHGQTSHYFFPPNPMSVNANVDRDRIGKWTEIFGKATASAFDEHGWLYFIRDEFDLYYAGYLDSWTSLTGAIGMTHETDGGRQLARERPDGTILTLRDGMEKHMTSAIAVIESAASRRNDLVTSFAAYKKRAVSGDHAGKFRQVVVPPWQDKSEELVALLARHGIQVSHTATAQKLEATDYWSGEKSSRDVPAGSLVVDMAQAQGPLAKALLEPFSDFEPAFIQQELRKRDERRKETKFPEPDDLDFYDMTGWCLIYLFGLDAYWSDKALATVPGPPRSLGSEVASLENKGTGWAVLPRSSEEMVALMKLLSSGVRARVATRTMRAGTMKLDPGTVIVPRAINSDDVLEKIRRSGVGFVTLPTAYPETGADGPGSASAAPLRKPEVGLVFGGDFGSAWYALERTYKIPFTPLAPSSLSGDLSKYSSILVPGGASASEGLKDWVSGGGCLIVLGSPNWAVGSGKFVELEVKKHDPEAMPVPGSIFRAEVDPRSFLSWGVGRKQVAVPIDGSRFYSIKKQGGAAVTLSADDAATKRLHGWAWPDETEKALAGTVWLHEERVGQGRVVVFMEDPTSRAMWPGLERFLLNAILYGPRP